MKIRYLLALAVAAAACPTWADHDLVQFHNNFADDMLYPTAHRGKAQGKSVFTSEKMKLVKQINGFTMKGSGNETFCNADDVALADCGIISARTTVNVQTRSKANE
jgi:hypothetical protein